MEYRLTNDQLDQLCKDFLASFVNPTTKQITFNELDQTLTWLFGSKEVRGLYDEMQYEESLATRRAGAEIIFMLAMKIAQAELEARKKYEHAYEK